VMDFIELGFVGVVEIRCNHLQQGSPEETDQNLGSTVLLSRSVSNKNPARIFQC
jgi:hypothetical protein